jgi:hypothetical protein
MPLYNNRRRYMALWSPVRGMPSGYVVEAKNQTLNLLRQHPEAVLNFLPWSERGRVVRAGYLTGRKIKRAQRLGPRFHQHGALHHSGNPARTAAATTASPPST